MTEHSKDEQGTILALLHRLESQRIPRLLEILEHVEKGEVLADLEISYLENAMQEASDNRKHISNYPEYQDIAVKLVELYEKIMAKALENQKAQK